MRLEGGKWLLLPRVLLTDSCLQCQCIHLCSLAFRCVKIVVGWKRRTFGVHVYRCDNDAISRRHCSIWSSSCWNTQHMWTPLVWNLLPAVLISSMQNSRMRGNLSTSCSLCFLANIATHRYPIYFFSVNYWPNWHNKNAYSYHLSWIYADGVVAHSHGSNAGSIAFQTFRHFLFIRS